MNNFLMTENNFKKDCEEILKQSIHLRDNWKIEKKINALNECNYYLVKPKCKLIDIDNNSFFMIDYHVTYNGSYCVPVLCFNGYKSDGTSMTLEDAWRIFSINLDSDKKTNLYSVLTQMDHSVLFQPYLTIHPCRTGELLGSLPNSINKVLSFISSYGPFIKLEMPLEYGLIMDL